MKSGSPHSPEERKMWRHFLTFRFFRGRFYLSIFRAASGDNDFDECRFVERLSGSNPWLSNFPNPPHRSFA